VRNLDSMRFCLGSIIAPGIDTASSKSRASAIRRAQSFVMNDRGADFAEFLDDSGVAA